MVVKFKEKGEGEVKPTAAPKVAADSGWKPKTVFDKKKPRVKKLEPTQEVGSQVHSTQTVKHSDGSEEVQHEQHGGFVIAQEPLCAVTVHASNTMNMGNYNSIRVGVDITLPCARDDVDDAFDAAKKWIDERMDELTEHYGPPEETPKK